MELLLLGVVGQVLSLRLLAIQLARTPDDPPLVRRRLGSWVTRERRRRRQRWITRAAVLGFAFSTAASLAGIVAIVRT